jgi:hypothetical protein
VVYRRYSDYRGSIFVRHDLRRSAFVVRLSGACREKELCVLSAFSAPLFSGNSTAEPQSALRSRRGELFFGQTSLARTTNVAGAQYSITTSEILN